MRDCILQNDAQRCMEVNPYLYSYWRDLHVHLRLRWWMRSNSPLNTRRSTWVSPPHTTRQLGYNYTQTICILAVVPASKWKPLLNCSEPNEEIQIDFGGSITNENDQDIHFLACNDRSSKYPTVEIFAKANGPNVIKFLDEYIQTHGVPKY